MELDGRGGKKKLREVRGGETIIRTYCMQKVIFSNNNKNTLSKIQLVAVPVG